jgi:hypothetical protein
LAVGASSSSHRLPVLEHLPPSLLLQEEEEED